VTSSASELERAASITARAGADLRAARERVGWRLDELATALRIRPQYLEALEAGRIGELPGNAYAVGYLRTYARALGLDPEVVTRRFKVEAAIVNERPQLTFPAPARERRVPTGAVVLLGVVLAGGAYAGWYRLSGEGKLPAETTTEVPQHLASLADQALQPPRPATATSPSPAAPAPPLALAPPAEAPPVPAISPGSAAAAAVTTASAATGGRPDQPRILLRANADAWVQVRDRSGLVLFTRIMHAGDTWEVPLKPNLLLTTGNAGGTDLVVDGVTMPPLGGSGVVRRDLPLDPDLIRDGKLAVATSKPSPQ
jgi:cytoskeleton protein RodZ